MVVQHLARHPDRAGALREEWARRSRRRASTWAPRPARDVPAGRAPAPSCPPSLAACAELHVLVRRLRLQPVHRRALDEESGQSSSSRPCASGVTPKLNAFASVMLLVALLALLLAGLILRRSRGTDRRDRVARRRGSASADPSPEGRAPARGRPSLAARSRRTTLGAQRRSACARVSAPSGERGEVRSAAQEPPLDRVKVATATSDV